MKGEKEEKMERNKRRKVYLKNQKALRRKKKNEFLGGGAEGEHQIQILKFIGQNGILAWRGRCFQICIRESRDRVENNRRREGKSKIRKKKKLFLIASLLAKLIWCSILLFIYFLFIFYS